MAYSKPEPLRGGHELDRFSSGEESLDGWLRRYARHAESSRSAKVYVTTDDGRQVVGYHALTVGPVQRQDASARLLKGQPAASGVPVAVLARLAVDERHQGRGLGRSLLQDALLRVAAAAEHLGIRALVVHALTDEARAFYLRFGFEPSPTDPLHLILLMKDLERLLSEE